MSDLSVRSQANHLADDLDGVVKTLDRALDETASLVSSVAALEGVLSDVGLPLASALESLRDVAWLRDQADDAAQARAELLIDDVIRIMSNAKDGLIAAEQYQQDVLEKAKRLVDVVGSEGASGCAEALGKAASKASGLHETAKRGHQTLKGAMGPKHESVGIARKIQKRTNTAEKAVKQACGGVAAACDTIGEFKGAVSALQVPSPAPLETALPQLQAFDLTSSDPLPDIGDLEQLAARAKKSHQDVSELPAVKDVDDKISSAKEETNKASGKLRAV